MINGFYQNNTNNHFLFGLPVNNNHTNTAYFAPKNNIAYTNYPSQYIINKLIRFKIIILIIIIIIIILIIIIIVIIIIK